MKPKLSKLYKELTGSQFLKHVAVLATGTGIGQIIGIVTSPISRRLYDAEIFGLFSLIITILTLVLPFATGRYEVGIVLSKKKEDAIHLGLLGLFLSVVVSLFSLLVLMFFRYDLASMLNAPRIANWLFFIPILILGNSLYSILYNYNTKTKDYKDISKTQITRAVAEPTIKIGLGLILRNHPIGLLISRLVGNTIGIGKLSKKVLKEFDLKKEFKKEALQKVAKEFKNFPLYTLPAGFAGIASVQIIKIFLSSNFSLAILGQYSLAMTLVSLPIAFLSTSISQVFYQELVDTKNRKGDCMKLFKKTLKTLSLASAIIFGIGYFIAEPVIEFVYGTHWKLAAQMSRILIPLLGVRFISSCLGRTNFAFNLQKIGLVNNITMLLTMLILIPIQDSLGWTFMEFLEKYVIIYSIEYFLFIIVYFVIIRNYQKSISN
jgi:O-antigen/teichoic acid export membrane protein